MCTLSKHLRIPALCRLNNRLTLPPHLHTLKPAPCKDMIEFPFLHSTHASRHYSTLFPCVLSSFHQPRRVSLCVQGNHPCKSRLHSSFTPVLHCTLWRTVQLRTASFLHEGRFFLFHGFTKSPRLPSSSLICWWTAFLPCSVQNHQIFHCDL